MLDDRGQPIKPALAARVRTAWGPLEPPRHVRPKCFSSLRQFLLWASTSPQPAQRESGFCTDCTPERKAAMDAGHRCEFPEVTFDRDEDGFVRGVR